MNGIGTDPRRWAAPFFTIWIGQMFSLVGSALGQFALVWWLTASTGSAAVLATASAAALLPTVLLGPLAGALVDRWDRRRTMIVADGAVALASAALAWLFWRGELQTWQVYAIVLVRAAGNLFHWPAMQASTALMVPERHLARVAGANQAARGAADIAAPPLGALLLALMPIYGVMLLDVATALMAIMPLCFVAVPRPERAAGALPSLRRDLRQGLAYVWRRVALRRVCGLTMMLHFFIVPAFSLLPLLITQRFGGGVAEVAWGSSAWGAGLVAGGVALGAWGGFRRRALNMLLGITGLGLGALGVGLAPAHAFPLALAGLLLAGAMDSLTVGSAFAWLQTQVPADLHGRVLSTVVSVTAAMMPLGMAVAGPFADRWGVRTWFLLAGGVQTLVGLAAWLAVAGGRFAEAPLDAAQAAEDGATGGDDVVLGGSEDMAL